MKLSKLLSVAALGVLLAGSAQAADLLYTTPASVQAAYSGGPYIGFEGGFNFQDGITGFINPPANTVGGTTEDSTGWNAGFKFGYAFGNNFFFGTKSRVELEYLHIENEGDNIATFNAGGPTGTFNANTQIDGDIGLVSWLVDLPLFGANSAFSPFVGVSGGYGKFDANANAGFINVLDDSDNAFVWGLTAGLSYAISNTTTIDASYRFLRAQDLNFAGPFAGGTLPAVNEDVDNHQINLGVRVKL